MFIACKFLQTPNKHLSGRGCPLCGNLKSGMSNIKSIENFIEDAVKIHKNKYNYSNSIYLNSNKKIEILCPIHGYFKQTPHYHLSGSGCKLCGYGIIKIKLTKSKSRFIEDAINIHGNAFCYDKTIYINDDTKIKIICNKHKHEFLQKPNNHLQGNGCPKCKGTISKQETLFLDILNINTRNFYISPYRVDGYDQTKNTIYEFLGDYWHGNPEKFKPEDINLTCKKSYKTLYDETFEKFECLNKNGYKIKYIWEKDWTIWKKSNQFEKLPLQDYPLLPNIIPSYCPSPKYKSYGPYDLEAV